VWTDGHHLSITCSLHALGAVKLKDCRSLLEQCATAVRSCFTNLQADILTVSSHNMWCLYSQLETHGRFFGFSLNNYITDGLLFLLYEFVSYDF
jgi:hypothetical protein